jgi:hypothetical protein
MASSSSALIWEMSREELNALTFERPDPGDGTDHFFVCSECGQAVDRRRLGDVMYHELQPEHEPLPVH